MALIRRGRVHWSVAGLTAVVVHLGIWWWSTRTRVTADIVIAFYGSRLLATALVLIPLALFVFPASSDSPPSRFRGLLLITGRLVWLGGLILFVVQAVLFQRNAMRLFLDRFALRLF